MGVGGDGHYVRWSNKHEAIDKIDAAPGDWGENIILGFLDTNVHN